MLHSCLQTRHVIVVGTETRIQWRSHEKSLWRRKESLGALETAFFWPCRTRPNDRTTQLEIPGRFTLITHAPHRLIVRQSGDDPT